jgi:hypothetical protein
MSYYIEFAHIVPTYCNFTPRFLFNIRVCLPSCQHMFWSSRQKAFVAFLVQDLCVVGGRKGGWERGCPKTLESIGGEGLERANREF